MVETVGIHQVMWFVMLKSAKDRVIRVDTQDNRCHDVSSMERLAYKLGMLWEVCVAQMRGKLA
jgi:hypothetical protein